MAEGLVNYTRLDDSGGENYPYPGLPNVSGTMKCGLPMPKEIHCRKGKLGRLMTRGSVYLPWLLQKPAAQCQRL
ncbi:Uncharacterised protein [Escherichia coli]|uniref:Uncharacterized protein n=1 Tax=Escherichia coli TaxID=562 RepID=A0A377KAP1_ECOLX|nr:Uncharacterised protein [Escherichia coli]